MFYDNTIIKKGNTFCDLFVVLHFLLFLLITHCMSIHLYIYFSVAGSGLWARGLTSLL